MPYAVGKTCSTTHHGLLDQRPESKPRQLHRHCTQGRSNILEVTWHELPKMFLSYCWRHTNFGRSYCPISLQQPLFPPSLLFLESSNYTLKKTKSSWRNLHGGNEGSLAQKPIWAPIRQLNLPALRVNHLIVQPLAPVELPSWIPCGRKWAIPTEPRHEQNKTKQRALLC
jgi:hypothetical protein